MRLLVTVAAVALAQPQPIGCCLREGPKPNLRTRDNRLLSKTFKLAALAPATGSVLVHNTDGLVRIGLDGSPGVVVDALPDAMTADGSIRVHRSGATYVVRTDDGERVVPDLVANDIGFRMAPDDRHVATSAETQDGAQLAIISLADATGRTFALPMDRFWQHRWADDGSALFHRAYGGDTWQRVDLATGAITETAPPIRTPDPDGSVDCPAKGFRLRVHLRGKRQRIVIDPIATADNPEELSALRPRLLVEAEHLPHDRLRDDPARFAHLKLIKPCDHFMFDFGGWVYLGEVATGRIAPLIRGYDPR